MSLAPRGGFSRGRAYRQASPTGRQAGTSALAALVFVAILSSIAFAVHEISPSDSAAQTAAVAGRLAADDGALDSFQPTGQSTVPSATDTADASRENLRSSIEALSSKDRRCIGVLQIQQDQDACKQDAQKCPVIDASQQVANICVPGCEYKIYVDVQSESGLTRVVAEDKTACAGQTGVTLSQCLLRLQPRPSGCQVFSCNGSSCIPADGGANPSASLQTAAQVPQSSVRIRADESILSVLSASRAADTTPESLQREVDKMPPYLQEAFQWTRGAIINDNREILRMDGITSDTKDGVERQIRNLEGVRVNSNIAGDLGIPEFAPMPGDSDSGEDLDDPLSGGAYTPGSSFESGAKTQGGQSAFEGQYGGEREYQQRTTPAADWKDWIYDIDSKDRPVSGTSGPGCVGVGCPDFDWTTPETASAPPPAPTTQPGSTDFKDLPDCGFGVCGSDGSWTQPDSGPTQAPEPARTITRDANLSTMNGPVAARETCSRITGQCTITFPNGGSDDLMPSGEYTYREFDAKERGYPLPGCIRDTLETTCTRSLATSDYIDCAGGRCTVDIPNRGDLADGNVTPGLVQPGETDLTVLEEQGYTCTTTDTRLFCKKDLCKGGECVAENPAEAEYYRSEKYACAGFDASREDCRKPSYDGGSGSAADFEAPNGWTSPVMCPRGTDAAWCQRDVGETGGEPEIVQTSVPPTPPADASPSILPADQRPLAECSTRTRLCITEGDLTDQQRASVIRDGYTCTDDRREGCSKMGTWEDFTVCPQGAGRCFVTGVSDAEKAGLEAQGYSCNGSYCRRDTVQCGAEGCVVRNNGEAKAFEAQGYTCTFTANDEALLDTGRICKPGTPPAPAQPANPSVPPSAGPAGTVPAQPTQTTTLDCPNGVCTTDNPGVMKQLRDQGFTCAGDLSSDKATCTKPTTTTLNCPKGICTVTDVQQRDALQQQGARCSSIREEGNSVVHECKLPTGTIRDGTVPNRIEQTPGNDATDSGQLSLCTADGMDQSNVLWLTNRGYKCSPSTTAPGLSFCVKSNNGSRDACAPVLPTVAPPPAPTSVTVKTQPQTSVTVQTPANPPTTPAAPTAPPANPRSIVPAATPGGGTVPTLSPSWATCGFGAGQSACAGAPDPVVPSPSPTNPPSTTGGVNPPTQFDGSYGSPADFTPPGTWNPGCGTAANTDGGCPQNSPDRVETTVPSPTAQTGGSDSGGAFVEPTEQPSAPVAAPVSCTDPRAVFSTCIPTEGYTDTGKWCDGPGKNSPVCYAGDAAVRPPATAPTATMGDSSNLFSNDFSSDNQNRLGGWATSIIPAEPALEVCPPGASRCLVSGPTLDQERDLIDQGWTCSNTNGKICTRDATLRDVRMSCDIQECLAIANAQGHRQALEQTGFSCYTRPSPDGSSQDTFCAKPRSAEPSVYTPLRNVDLSCTHYMYFGGSSNCWSDGAGKLPTELADAFGTPCSDPKADKSTCDTKTPPPVPSNLGDILRGGASPQPMVCGEPGANPATCIPRGTIETGSVRPSNNPYPEEYTPQTVSSGAPAPSADVNPSEIFLTGDGECMYLSANGSPESIACPKDMPTSMLSTQTICSAGEVMKRVQTATEVKYECVSSGTQTTAQKDRDGLPCTHPLAVKADCTGQFRPATTRPPAAPPAAPPPAPAPAPAPRDPAAPTTPRTQTMPTNTQTSPWMQGFQGLMQGIMAGCGVQQPQYSMPQQGVQPQYTMINGALVPMQGAVGVPAQPYGYQQPFNGGAGCIASLFARQPPAGNGQGNAQLPGTCPTTSTVCSNGMLYGRNSQCVDTLIQTCKHGCNGNTCAAEPINQCPPAPPKPTDGCVSDYEEVKTTLPTGMGCVTGWRCMATVKPTIVIVSNPPRVPEGDTSRLGWVTIGMKSCTIVSSVPVTASQEAKADAAAFTSRNAANLSTSGSTETQEIEAVTTFTLNCVQLDGQPKSGSATISPTVATSTPTS